jgi:hypothetical protein
MGRHVSDAQREQQAKEAALKAIARGDRPLYRIRQAPDRSWTVEWLDWLSPLTGSRLEALAGAKAAIAAWLEADTTAIEVEVAGDVHRSGQPTQRGQST